jgi:hypothetical protein
MLELTETMSPLKYRSQFFPLVRERHGSRDLHTLRGRVVLIDGHPTWQRRKDSGKPDDRKGHVQFELAAGGRGFYGDLTGGACSGGD